MMNQEEVRLVGGDAKEGAGRAVLVQWPPGTLHWATGKVLAAPSVLLDYGVLIPDPREVRPLSVPARFFLYLAELPSLVTLPLPFLSFIAAPVILADYIAKNPSPDQVPWLVFSILVQVLSVRHLAAISLMHLLADERENEPYLPLKETLYYFPFISDCRTHRCNLKLTVFGELLVLAWTAAFPIYHIWIFLSTWFKVLLYALRLGMKPAPYSVVTRAVVRPDMSVENMQVVHFGNILMLRRFSWWSILTHSVPQLVILLWKFRFGVPEKLAQIGTVAYGAHIFLGLLSLVASEIWQ